jgi:flagellum-specific ATP synthase
MLEEVPVNIDLSAYHRAVDYTPTVKMHGKVVNVVGLAIESEGPTCKMGELCYIHTKDPEAKPIEAEVVGFKGNRVVVMPLGDVSGIGPGCEVRATGGPLKVKVGMSLLGRVLDGIGNPIDGKGPIDWEYEYPVHNEPTNPFTRPRITKPLQTGVRVLDGFLTLGRGQRVGIFAGSGVGKSTLLGMIARNTDADINVLTLIGERNRELRDFLELDLGEAGLKRSVVVVATSDKPALVRRMGAYVGTAVAEYFRDQGKDVFLMMDSATRFAMAQREVGLAVGEPPATKGYTPSVFALFPKLLERPGTAPNNGSITALYTVLVEGDDMNEIIADTVRGILDGHIVLTRKIAHQNRYPAIDILQSISRLFNEITKRDHQDAAGKMRKVLDTYQKNEDLIKIGAYKAGSDADVDYAIKMIKDVFGFCIQRKDEPTPYDQTIEMMKNLMAR